MIRLYNTLSEKVDEFESIKKGEVKMYNCGPTVYGVQHIGNLSMFVFTDILRRTLEWSGLEVKQVINFTDFGHLSSDADEGEDKMAKGLKRDGLEPTLENMRKMAEKYAEIFLDDISKLNVETKDTKFPYASDFIPEQIDLIKTLEGKGYAYKTYDGVYYDTSKFADYGKLGGVKVDSGKSRIGTNLEKKNPQDFALWKFSRDLGWQSPWGHGFPGWHIECSAMIIKLLGEQIDIHTGGIEHIGVHHNNEIAQSEAATGKVPFSKYWLHREHLKINDAKIAKSEGNTVYLSEIIEKGISPIALRYLLLGSHYKTPTNFTWEALGASENALRKLKDFLSSLPPGGSINDKYKKEFTDSIENDLNTPEALAVVWKLVKDESISPADKRATLLDFDRVLGLKLDEALSVPEEVQLMLKELDQARAEKNFEKSDQIRQDIEKKGFKVKNNPDGSSLGLLS